MGIFNIVFILTEKQLALSGITRKAMLHLSTFISFEDSLVFFASCRRGIFFFFLPQWDVLGGQNQQQQWCRLSGGPWLVRKSSRWSKENILKQNNKSPAQEVFSLFLTFYFYVVYRPCLVRLQSLQHRNEVLRVYATLAQWGSHFKKGSFGCCCYSNQ